MEEAAEKLASPSRQMDPKDGKAGQRRRGVSKYAHLLEEDETFRAWYRNVLRESYNTGAWYLLRMGRLCDELCHVTPKRIAAMNKVELMTFMTNAISDLEEAGVSGVTINSYVKAVKSWGRFNGTRLDERISVPDSEPRYAGEVVPRPEDVQSLFDHSPPRVKVAVSLMGFSGLRPATIGNAEGTDGLKLADLPELEIKSGGGVAFAKVPAIIVVRKRISKIRASFVTFAPAQACEYIRQYLEDRMRTGEKLGPESALVTVSEFNRQTRRSKECFFKKPYGSVVTTANVRDLVRQAIRESGFGWRPYILRRYFDTRMMR